MNWGAEINGRQADGLTHPVECFDLLGAYSRKGSVPGISVPGIAAERAPALVSEWASELLRYRRANLSTLRRNRCALQARAGAADEKGGAGSDQGPNAENYRQRAHAHLLNIRGSRLLSGIAARQRVDGL